MSTSSDSRDAPPPYEPSDAESQQLFNSIQTAFRAEQGSEDATPDQRRETDRLRNFLLYCLAVNYRFSGASVLSATDREHYLEMRALFFEVDCARDSPTLTRSERRTLAPYFWKHLYLPCRSLSLPTESAVLMIERFAAYTQQSSLFSGNYKGSVHGTLHNWGPRGLAAKLQQDRSILIPALLAASSDAETKEALTGKLTERAQLYFVSIRGIESAIDAEDKTRGETGRTSTRCNTPRQNAARRTSSRGTTRWNTSKAAVRRTGPRTCSRGPSL